MSDRGVEPPDYTDLVAELGLIRREGITKLRSLDLPALEQAARASGDLDDKQATSPAAIESVVRGGIDELGASRVSDTALILLGLEHGTRDYTPSQLRRDAAERWGVSEARFRRDPQDRILSEIAEAILRRAHEHQVRLSRANMERRLPTTSRLAISWLERFEAYHRIWTPTSGIAGDLTAYRSTLLETDRPYDRDPGTDGPDDPGYTQELQAAGYVTFAIWHYTRFLINLKAFMDRFGGMWLMSDAQAEQDIADATYRVRWHNPNNERDDSYLRDLHQRSEGELHLFLNLFTAEGIGRRLHQEWQDWAHDCRCEWDHDHASDREHYPTHRHHPGIDERCQMHAVITACNDYCILVDDDWKRIADWYRLPEAGPVATDAEILYAAWRTPRDGPL